MTLHNYMLHVYISVGSDSARRRWRCHSSQNNDAVETGRCLQTKLVENMHIASKAGRSNISADYFLNIYL